MSTRVEDLPLDKITVGERCREDYGDLSELVESIKALGVIQPISVDESYNLLAGGRRYRAAGLAGLATIPAVVRIIAGPVDALEIELVENVCRKDLTWQERARQEKKLYELKQSMRDTAEATGQAVSQVHRHVELGRALERIPKLGDYKTEADAWKALKKAQEQLVIQELIKRQEEKVKELGVNNPGVQAYSVADAHYRVGDCAEEMNVFQDGVFNFAEIDPPYAVDLDMVKQRQSEVDTVGLDRYTEVNETDYAVLMATVLQQTKRLLAPGSFCICWFGPSTFTLTKALLEQAGFTVCGIPAIWDKGNQGQTNQPYINLGNCYEMFFVARLGSPSLAKPGRPNVFRYAPVPPQQKIHPTEKPIELMLEILDTFCHPNMKILSPFLGSGVTLRAAYMRKTWGVGWDLSEQNKQRFLLRVQEDEDNGSYK